MSTSIVWILKLDLKFFSYCFQIKHQLTANDEKTLVDLCNWFNDKMEENEDWIDKVWFSDDAHFHLDGCINSKNTIFWELHHQRNYCNDLCTSLKVTAWCAINLTIIWAILG